MIKDTERNYKEGRGKPKIKRKKGEKVRGQGEKVRGQVEKGAMESGEKKMELLWESSLFRRQEGWRDFISSRCDQASCQQFTVVEFSRFFFVCVYVCVCLGN